MLATPIILQPAPVSLWKAEQYKSKPAVINKIADLVLALLLNQQPISIEYIAQFLIVAAIQRLSVRLQLLYIFVVHLD